jgi:hypothetical protein
MVQTPTDQKIQTKINSILVKNIKDLVMIYYRQCLLCKKVKDKTNQQTAWIPEKFSKIGSFVKIKTDNVWDDGWRVIKRGKRATEKQIAIYSNQYKKTREVSDV